MENVAKKNYDVWKIVSVVILGLYILFLIYPLIKLLYNALTVSEILFTVILCQIYY